jgi:hypothetical protein
LERVHFGKKELAYSLELDWILEWELVYQMFTCGVILERNSNVNLIGRLECPILALIPALSYGLKGENSLAIG